MKSEDSTGARARAVASAQALAELRAIRRGQEQLLRQLVALCRLVDEFAGVFLNARFQFGKPSDRWGGRRG